MQDSPPNIKIVISWFSIYAVFVLICVVTKLGTWWFLSTVTFPLGVCFALYERNCITLINNKYFKSLVILLFLVTYSILFIIPLYETLKNNSYINYIITALDMVLAPLFLFVCMFIVQRINLGGHFTK